MNLKNNILLVIFLTVIGLAFFFKKEEDYKALLQQNMLHILAQQNYNSKAIFTDLINITDNQEVINIINLNRQKFAYWQIIRKKTKKNIEYGK